MNGQIESHFAALGLRTADVEEKFVRGSGPGGQKINKTSSTVWLRHWPTGIEVRNQSERSQAANRERAWAELVAKLEARAPDRGAGGRAGARGRAAPDAAEKLRPEDQDDRGQEAPREAQGPARKSKRGVVSGSVDGE